MIAGDFCGDCFRCTDCERVQCSAKPYCQHEKTCDQCYPSPSCEACTQQLTEEGALT